MGNQHQPKSDTTDHSRKRHPEVSDDGELETAKPNRALQLSPHATMKLQRTIGNQAVLRLLAGNHSGRDQHSERQIGFATPGIQRDVLNDVRIDSGDFWVNMRSRAFTRYVSWIGDARAKLFEFVDVMGADDTSATNAWTGAFKSWIQVFGTLGDVTNAVIETLGAMVTGMEEKSSLQQFSKEAHRKFDALSDKVNNLRSDMPVYRALAQKEHEEKGQSDKDSFRVKARDELEQALALLPNADRLYQELTLSWARGGSKWFDDKRAATIYLATSYKIYESVGLPGYSFEEVRSDNPLLLGAEKSKNTVRALKNAFGETVPVHKLPLRMAVKFFEAGGYAVGTMVKKQHAWVPYPGLGSDKLDGLFEAWLENGKKPTLGDLVANE